MKFVIQHNLMNTEQLMQLKSAVEKYPHTYVGVIPFSRVITADEILEDTNYIPYGSTLFTTIVEQDYKWKGLHFDLNTFNYLECSKHRNDMLNDEIIISVKSAIDFFDTNITNDFFMRPSKDLKQFSGQVFQAKEARDFLKDAVECESSGSYKLDESEMVVISRPKEILAEWRWFIIDGKVVDGSMYRAHGQLRKIHETDQEVIREAQSFADKWLPDSCCVMDLGLTKRGLKVIEFNCINSSGFYDNDISKIIDSWYNYEIMRA